jgi:hypothetical protein
MGSSPSPHCLINTNLHTIYNLAEEEEEEWVLELCCVSWNWR